jgi:hypothetical protein
MYSPYRSSAIVFSCAGAVILALACSDATGPGEPRHPIVGVYDVTATLQTYEYPTSTTMPYTFDTVAAGSARLSGTLTIDDSVVVKPGTVELPEYAAYMQETDIAGNTRSADYTTAYVPLRVSGDSMGVSGVLGSAYESLVLPTGTFAGDSIVGTLEWDARLGPRHEIYRGTYVARRHR